MQAAAVRPVLLAKRRSKLTTRPRTSISNSRECTARVQNFEGSSGPRYGKRKNAGMVRNVADAMRAAPLLWGGLPTVGALERLVEAEGSSVELAGPEPVEVQPAVSTEVEQVDFAASEPSIMSDASRLCLALRSGYINPYQVESLLFDHGKDCYT